jgi:hypothetical protein
MPDNLQLLSAKAAKLIGLTGTSAHLFRNDTELAISDLLADNIQHRSGYLPRSKKAKLAAGRLALALHRVLIVLKDADLGFRIHRYFPEAELRRWAKRCEQMAAVKSRKPKPSASAKMRAAMSAYNLMHTYGVPIVTTANSKFCKLAALLYQPLPGERGKDLQHQCRAVVRAKRGRK